MSESSQRLPAYCNAFPCTRALSAPFSRLSACSRARAFVRFHALTHFAPDHTQTAYHGSHIRVFSVPSHIMRRIPARACLARLSRAYQLVPALAHLRVFHALMHFVPDCTQTAYHDSHIRLFLAPSCTMRHVPVHVRLARLSRAHQHIPALAHLRVFHALMCFHALAHFCARSHSIALLPERARIVTMPPTSLEVLTRCALSGDTQYLSPWEM
jgi:hypothetical protein